MVCYELLVGDRPFSGNDTSELLGNISSGKLPELPNDLPTHLHPFVSVYQACVSPAYERPSSIEVKRILGALDFDLIVSE